MKKNTLTASIEAKSGTAKIVPWGDDVNTPSLSKFYKFEKLIMKDLQSETQLSVPDSKISEIDDTDAINLGEKVYTTDDYRQ